MTHLQTADCINYDLFQSTGFCMETTTPWMKTIFSYDTNFAVDIRRLTIGKGDE